MSAESFDTIECPACGVMSEPGDRFCRGCGAGLMVGAGSGDAEASGSGDNGTRGANRSLWILASALVMAGLACGCCLCNSELRF